MQLISEVTHKERKSKFIAHYYEISSEQEIQALVAGLKKKHKKSNHVCWAAIVDDRELFKNDGEVGNPANTMLEILKSKEKRQRLIAIVRYFGGIKLGPGGVKRASKEAMLLCLLQKG